MIVVHDGYPANFDRAVAQMRALDRQYAGRMYIVGVYLSDDATEAEQLRALCPRLIHASPRTLPAKLGDLLAALGSTQTAARNILAAVFCVRTWARSHIETPRIGTRRA